MPISAAPAQPPAPKARNTPAGRPRPAPSADVILRGRAEAVYGIFQLGSAVCLMTKQMADAAALTEHGENVSLECAKLAETDERFANVIDKLTSVGPYAGLLTAVMPLAMQLAVNHKRIEAGVMGTVSPDALAAKVKADMASKQADFLREAREAQERAEKAKAEFQEVA